MELQCSLGDFLSVSGVGLEVNRHSSGKCSSVQIPINKLMKFIFQRKPKTDNYIPINLNGKSVQLCEWQKHLVVFLDKYLNFFEDIKIKVKICNKLIGNIKSLSVHLLCLTVFVQPHLDYGDILSQKLVNESLINSLEKIQCQAWLAIAGAIQGTSRESFYKNLWLESLQRHSFIRYWMV